jgi:hypothetical protein
MKPFIRYTALILSILFLSGAALVWFDVLTHDNVFTNPQLKVAAGWLTTGLMLLALALRGRRRDRSNAVSSSKPAQSARE